MITANDHALKLFNGDIGLCVLDPIHNELSVLFEAEGGVRSLPPSRVPPHETAWAMTVHKSQGSEFNRVYFLLTPDAIRHGRSLLYTGFTREKEQIEIWSEEITIKAFFETSCPDQLLSFQEELLTLLDKKGH